MNGRAPPKKPWSSPDLARRRAASIAALEYGFELAIDAAGRVLTGSQHIDFVLDARGAAEELVLDWQPHDRRQARERLATSLRVNGDKAPRVAARLAGGHLVIAADRLQAGPNRIELAWRASIRTAGGALTRFRDPADGALYVHTLFVPADASSIFPCFDQPDLKARFKLVLRVPKGWKAIANAPLVACEQQARASRFRFAPTEPLSTYLFAFAAGAFVAAGSDASGARLWVRRSQRASARRHADAVLALQQRAIRGCARYFGHRFPFAKRDLVLIPQFPYRGMEHPGAVFLAEKDVLLPAAPSPTARFERAQLVFHEIAHQWLGNLVTMRSFADLWLKEGFANFMAYRQAARTAPRALADVAFHTLKAQAYRTDRTPGTTALHYPLRDVSDARAAYGSIVYAKAPALLRQLERMLGPDVFRRGVQALVRRHAHAAIDWRDLIAAFESAAGCSLATWAQRWILRPGAPQLGWETGTRQPGHIVLRLTQRPVGSSRHAPWPLHFEVEIARANGAAIRKPVTMDGAQHELSVRGGGESIRHVLINVTDDAYVLPAPDACGIARAQAVLPGSSPLARIQTWEMLWQAVLDQALDPARFVALAIAQLHAERNALIVQAVLMHVRIALDRLLHPAHADRLAVALDRLLLERARGASAQWQPLWLEQLTALARTPPALEKVEALLHARVRAGALSPALRCRAAVALVVRGALSEARARRAVAALGEPARLAAEQIAAACPRPARKRAVLARLLHGHAAPDQTLVAAASVLFHPAHAHSTQSLLAPALRALPALARRRKIFFVNGWIAAAIGGQNEAAALATAQRFASGALLDVPTRRKCAEAAFELAQVVAIRRARNPLE